MSNYENRNITYADTNKGILSYKDENVVKCEGCGIEFEREKHNGHKQRFHNMKCANTYHNRLRPRSLKCAHCGGHFKADFRNEYHQRFCCPHCQQQAMYAKKKIKRQGGMLRGTAIFKIVSDPDNDGWPAGCTLSGMEMRQSLDIGNFTPDTIVDYRGQRMRVIGEISPAPGIHAKVSQTLEPLY